MADVRPLHAPPPPGATGVIVFSDGRTVWGQGFGAEGEAVGELCFNTAMTGYQEVMTDPSYAKQVIAFTFPHIGNVGANDEDVEAAEAHDAPAIVIGRRGRGALAAAVLGSVSMSLLHAADRPVLVA